MMIGGTDIFIPVPAGEAGLDLALRTIWRHWPEAVAENAITRSLAGHYDAVEFAGATEFLVYKNFGCFDDEISDACAPPDTMIHVLLSAAGITLVLDSKPGPEQLAITESVKHALRMNTFGVGGSHA